MGFLKGAFSRHISNRNKKRLRKLQFGSRRSYRRQKKSWGGKGHSF